MHDLLQTLSHDMFHMPLPLAEKILRPVIVYLCLVVFLRLFGKRELAQLNPFDLVVLLSLSNTVQNAMIGDDNSVSGGVVGAFALLAINWVLARLLFKLPKVNEALEGTKTVLISHGKVDFKALEEETLTELELRAVLHKQGINDYAEVETCVLEPNGTFYVEGKKPSSDSLEREEMIRALQELSTEVKALRREIEAKG